MKEIEYVRAYPIFYTSTLSIALENKISARVMLKVTVCCADDDESSPNDSWITCGQIDRTEAL